MAPEVAVTIIVLLPIGVPDDLLELPPQALSESMQKSASSRLAAPKRSARVLATLANGRRRVTSRSNSSTDHEEGWTGWTAGQETHAEIRPWPSGWRLGGQR